MNRRGTALGLRAFGLGDGRSSGHVDARVDAQRGSNGIAEQLATLFGDEGWTQ